MSYETLTLAASIFVVGIGLGGLIIPRLSRLEAAVRDLSNRVARIEGAMPFLQSQRPDPPQ